MQMGEPWEALDLDDSDIASTFCLRRCSRQSPQSPPHSQPSPNPFSSPSSQAPPQEQPPSSSSRRVPGPAGAVQAAMHRKKNLLQNAEVIEISTQEYIRRFEEDSGEEFSRNPWVFALDFLGDDGMVDATPLSDIKKCANSERIAKVVAIVKSCVPNGLGDTMITLKDPTDTIGASVHGKVLSVGEFGKLIAVGSVLILQKVVAFYSSCASCYLNITRSNVVKVITVDCEVQSFPETNVRAIPVFDSNSEVSEKNLGLVCRTGGTSRDVLHYNLKGKAVTEKLMGRENSPLATNLVCSKPIENNISEERIHIDLVDSGSKGLNYINKWHDGDDSRRSSQPGPVLTEVMSRNQDLDNAEKRRQLRDFSSAPCITENLENRHAWQGNGTQIGRPLRGNNFIISMAEKLEDRVGSSSGASLSTAENLDGFASCGIRTNDGQTQVEHRKICFTPSMANNQARENVCKINDPLKQTQPPDMVFNLSKDAKGDGQEENGANVVKKQRLALISRTSVQEWTDDQLGILDMDED